jgi:hypothetical protein
MIAGVVMGVTPRPISVATLMPPTCWTRPGHTATVPAAPADWLPTAAAAVEFALVLPLLDLPGEVKALILVITAVTVHSHSHCRS